MSEVRGIVVGHGGMAAGMVDATRAITGIPEEALVPFSNRGLSPEALLDGIRTLLSPDHDTILFTDLQSGSCAVAARRLTMQLPRTSVVSGVNLPVLLEFAMNRSIPMNELVDRLIDRGRTAIISATPPQP